MTQAKPDTVPTDAPLPTALAEHSPDWDDGPWTVNGVALPENEAATGVAGDPVFYPATVLEAATDALVGRNIVDDRDHDNLDRANPAVENIIGEVTATSFEPGVGLLYEGEVDDPETAKQIERGRVDPSPMLWRHLGEYDDDREAYPAEEIVRFRDLAVVSEGASAGASIQPGAATALQAEALRAAFVGGSDTSDDGTESGDPGADEDGQQMNSNTEESPEMELTDDEEALIHTARSTDGPVVVSAKQKALANDAQNLNISDFEDPTVLETDEFETMQERVSSVKEVFAEALAERTDMKLETADALSLDVLMGEFENDDGEFAADALTQTPEAGGVDDSEDDDGPDADALERIEQIDAKLDAVGAALPDSRVEELRDEAADLADVDDYADALEAI